MRERKGYKRINTGPGNAASPIAAGVEMSPGRFLVHLFIIIAVGLLVYSNTFHVPFHYDDEDFIILNPVIKNVSYLVDPAKIGNDTIPVNVGFTLRSRFVSYFTFWANYAVHGLRVSGYHVVNLSVHIVNAVLVYLIVFMTLKTPFLKTASEDQGNRFIPLFSSLLFVAHPLQTEAVTYITQRFTSLVALFYLLALALYIAWRISDTPAPESRKLSRTFLYAGSFLSAAVAMKTKENAFTLPFVMIIYESLFFDGPIKRRMANLIPFIFVALIVPLGLFDSTKPIGVALDKAARTQKTPRLHYLITEFSVIVTYIRLIFLPVNQNLVYDYPLFTSILSPRILASLSFLIFLLCAALYLLYRSRKADKRLRLVAFGMVWFFVNLSIESSIVPLYSVIFEHRVYLPLVGALTAVSTGIFLLAGKNKKIAVISLIVFTALLSAAAYSRNSVWESAISLWADTAEKSPHKADVQYNLGLAYAGKGLMDEAIAHFQAAKALKPDKVEAYNNLGVSYISKGLNDKAIDELQKAIGIKQDYAEAHYNLGLAWEAKGMYDKAIEQYEMALRLKPNFTMAHYSLGIVYKALGRSDKAKEHFLLADKLKNNP